MSSETERITNQVIDRHDLEEVMEGSESANLQQVDGRPLTAIDSHFTQRRRMEAQASTGDSRPDFLSRILAWILTRPSNTADAY